MFGWAWAECAYENDIQDNGVFLSVRDPWLGGGEIYADGAALDLADALDTEADMLMGGRNPGDPW